MNQTNDLFDDAGSAWCIDPQTAFESFVISPEFVALSRRRAKRNNEQAPRLRASSARIYVLMWSKFVRWMTEEKKEIFGITPKDLLAFLERRDDGKRVLEGSTIRRQYLTLFERVFTHLNVNPNPAIHACFDVVKNKRLAGANSPTVALTNKQQVAFMRALPAPETWQRRRDRAMQALMIGAGLKVSEVIGLRVENVGGKDESGSVPITVSPASAGGVVRWHQTQLRPFAVREVLAWLNERKTLKIGGKLLFPASEHGEALHKATVYRQTKATFERAKLPVARLGGRTLRNSFAMRELRSQPVELVSEFLGHRRLRSIETYQRCTQVSLQDVTKTKKW